MTNEEENAIRVERDRLSVILRKVDDKKAVEALRVHIGKCYRKCPGGDVFYCAIRELDEHGDLTCFAFTDEGERVQVYPFMRLSWTFWEDGDAREISVEDFNAAWEEVLAKLVVIPRAMEFGS